MSLTPAIIPCALAIVASSGLSVYVWRNRRIAGSIGLFFLFVAVTIWLLAEIFELGLNNPDSKMLSIKAEYLGIVSVPMAWLMFALQYTGRGSWITPRRLVVSWIIPVTTLALVWTNELHGLIWADFDIIQEGWVTVWERTYGPWFWIHTSYSYGLLAAGAALLFRSARTSFPLYRRQALVIGMAVLVPLVWNVIYILRISAFQNMHFTPLAFALSGFLLVVGIARYRLLDVVPVARETATERIGDGLIVLDDCDRVVDVNAAALSIIRRPQARIIGRHIAHVLPIGWVCLSKSRSGSKETRYEVALGSNGRGRHYELSLSRMHDGTGNTHGCVLVIHDITDIKRMEAELQQSVERERELRKSLEHEMDQRLEFTRALVHEMRTPITSVMATSEILSLGLREEPWLSMSSSVHRGITHLNNRIGELLDVAKGQVGRLDIEPDTGDILGLLRDIATDIGPSAAKQSRSIELNLPSAISVSCFDAQRIRQVVMNLLDNALKFTDEGGSIELGVEMEDSRAVVSVKDDGRGISPADMEHLFKAYSHLEGSGKGSAGLGVGLALSRILVELHGGEIWAESEEGQGSVFSFSLPLNSYRIETAQSSLKDVSGTPQSP
jgi:PAS domain S-box-containing protein